MINYVRRYCIKTIKKILIKAEFKSRKKGSPNPKNNKSPLEQIPYDKFHICNPEHYAALIIDGGHFYYNAGTANRIRKSILENL